MALNLSTVKNIFSRVVKINIANDKGTFTTPTINCSFKRKSKEDAQIVEDLISAAESTVERESIIKTTLDEVWLNWDVVDDNGPLAFTAENRERVYSTLPNVMIEVYVAWVRGIMGTDRKNA